MPSFSPRGPAGEAAFSYPPGLQAPPGLLLPVSAPTGLALSDGRHPALPPDLSLPDEDASGNDYLMKKSSDTESTRGSTSDREETETSDREETEFEAEEGFHTQLKVNAPCVVPSFVPRQMEASARIRADEPWFVPLPSYRISPAATQGLQKMPVRSLRKAIHSFGSPHQSVSINDGNRNQNGEVAHLEVASGVADPEVALGGASDSPKSRRHRDMCLVEQIKAALVDLNGADDCQHKWALQWVSEMILPLAKDAEGCRLVQKAMQVGTPVYLLQLLGSLRGHTNEVAQSMHGNCILQTFIEMVPSEQLQFIIAEMLGSNCSILSMARQSLGCHRLGWLVKHCKPWQTELLIKKVLSDTGSLCRHQFGHLLLQYILQYGSSIHRSAIAHVVVADIISLSTHRHASKVVSCTLAHCSPEDVERITHALLHDEQQLQILSRKEYGSSIAREVKRRACLL